VFLCNWLCCGVAVGKWLAKKFNQTKSSCI
jgi:hypothetical protein